MLLQQLHSMRSIKIEADDVHLPTGQLNGEYAPHECSLIDTPSIAVANYDNQYTSMYRQLLITLTPVNHIVHLKDELEYRDFESIQPLLNYYHNNHLKEELTPCDIKQPLLYWIYYYFGDFSQSTACNAIRFGECSLTSLDKLWYTYSYIYKPTTTTI